MKTIKVNDRSEIPNYFTGIVDYLNEDKEWFKNGKQHQEDGPAVEHANGSRIWYKNGKLHREDGPAMEFSDGTKQWWVEGKCHRTDGPALEYSDGTKYWFKDGNRHREDGPAVEYSNETKEWWFEGQYYSNINLNNYVVLDSYQGKYGIMWYKFFNEDEIFEYPDIPGLITK